MNKDSRPQEIQYEVFTGSWVQEPGLHDFTGCKWAGCDLSGQRFAGILDRCEFEDCNLSLTIFEQAKLQDVRFLRCKLLGVDFTRCSSLGLALSFRECLIASCNFNYLVLPGTCLSGCEIRETDFVGCNLSRSSFAGSVLHGVTFHETNLAGADFTAVQGYRINPLTNHVKDARFGLPEAVSLLECMGIKLQQ